MTNKNLRRRSITKTELEKKLPLKVSTSEESQDSQFGNIVLLILLYLLQGIPTGLALGSLPYLLKSKVSYSELALFSLSGYPYSLKLLWSPIVDMLYFKSFGRRKSWIIPLQFLIAGLLYWLGKHMDSFFDNNGGNLLQLTIIFFSLIFLAATQDIAVDGWALTLLSKESISYASTSQTIGLNTGYFLSFTIFLALLSPEFCNTYLRKEPLEKGVITLGSYMTFWSIAYLIITLYTIMKEEKKPQLKDEEYSSIKEGYLNILHICKLPHMKKLILVLLVCKIGFMANESITGLKLMELGLKKEDLALTVLIDFPFQILFGYLAAKWSNGKRPLKPWLFAFYARLAMAFVSVFLVYCFPKPLNANTAPEIGLGFFMVVMVSIILSSFTSTVMFVSISAFFSKIADPTIGGTYMTLLNTLSNFGGTWPKYFVLKLVDFFTTAECTFPITEKTQAAVFSCAAELSKAKCETLGGTCTVIQDGYFSVSYMCVFIGLLFLMLVIRSNIKDLEKLPIDSWKLKRY